MRYELKMRDSQTSETITIEAETLAEAREMAEAETIEWVEGGEWGNEGASIEAWWTLTDADGDEVDSDAVTVDIPAEQDALIPETECGDSVDDHEWTSDGCGGLDENPGVFATGGTTLLIVTHCLCCGLTRKETKRGSQRNPGEHDTVEFELPSDED